jgi:hypothetical protein
MVDDHTEQTLALRERVIGCAQVATAHWHVEPRYKAKILLALLGDQECASEESEASEGASSNGDTSDNEGHDEAEYNDEDEDDDETELIDMI